MNGQAEQLAAALRGLLPLINRFQNELTNQRVTAAEELLAKLEERECASPN